jgi:predicted amidohydrolase
VNMHSGGASDVLRRSPVTTDVGGSAIGTMARNLSIATAQLRPDRSFDETLEKVLQVIAQAAGKGVELMLFPEVALPGYTGPLIAGTTQAQLDGAIELLSAVCKANHIAIVIGVPTRGFNSALAIDWDGAIRGKQDKMQLVPPDAGWSAYGERLQVLHLCGGVPCGVLICHDKRYPELARLLVLGGARLLLYMACEQWHDDLPLTAPREPLWDMARFERELGVYRAQLQARAVENGVWLVKSNCAFVAAHPTLGSHGHSCVIDPSGIVVAEAGLDEEVLIESIDLDRATATYALKSLLPEFALSSWWRDGVRRFVSVDGAD